MVTPYYTDEHVTLYHGDAAAVLAKLEPGSVDCIVTSPPYFGLRDYGVDGQIGAESSPTEFVSALVSAFREARRVLADDGTLWLNLGDSYGPDKRLLGVPWQVALALQADGWILRNEIIWHKPNAMPESVTDRLGSRHEHLFMFSKSRRYWFDLDTIREQAATSSPVTHWTERKYDQSFLPADKRQANGVKGRVSGVAGYGAGGRNPGDVWSINTRPFPGAHFAVFPPALAERCILAGCKPGGIVLDPFSGSGTTGMVATKQGRRYVGIDLNEDYLRLSLETRLSQGVLDLGVGA